MFFGAIDATDKVGATGASSHAHWRILSFLEFEFMEEVDKEIDEEIGYDAATWISSEIDVVADVVM